MNPLGPREARDIPFWVVPYKSRWRVYWDEQTRNVRVFDMAAWGHPAGLRDREGRAKVKAFTDWYTAPFRSAEPKATVPSAPRDAPTPYPWRYGYPIQAACLASGYCHQWPSCGD